MFCSKNAIGALVISVQLFVSAADSVSPRIDQIETKGPNRILKFSPYPAAEEFKIFRTDNLAKPFAEDVSGLFAGYDWTAPSAGTGNVGFYRVGVTPLSNKEVLTATVLNRVAYGPTPDEIERVTAIGPEAYIQEQLAPELIEESLSIDSVPTNSGWRYITVTGPSTTSTEVMGRLMFYLTTIGDGYIDDLKLVRGVVAEAGTNLLRNGDFEAPLSRTDWVIETNLTGSALVTDVKHSGNSSLHIVATSPGNTSANSIHQEPTTGLVKDQVYTLSYWYLPGTNTEHSLVVRVSDSNAESGANGIYSTSSTLLSKLTSGAASIGDLQAWFALHAVRSRRQLLEVLSQFVDNHFTTYYGKTRDYMDGRVTDGQEMIATEFEFRELAKWREVLMNPNGTFYDLLKISAESPTMIIYLDTVTSKTGAANENYARELMELFTMGVDNGYDQRDIEEMSRAWTGWRVDKLPLAQKDNPFATAVSNVNTDPGYWTVRFSRSNHDTAAKTIFPGKTVDARFGPPYAGQSYELKLPARTDTLGMKDGYDAIAHLANLPYTQEYISVKLCRLFVHEDFHHGLYDYTQPDLSAEAALVRDCMKAWDTAAADGRKGNLRSVVKVILDSELFKSQRAARHKVKTPFEFAVSTVRSLRAQKASTAYTSDSAGADMIDPMRRMGLRLFYREEPDGWPEAGRDWINTSSLVERMRFTQGFVKSGSRLSDPVGLLKLKLASDQWRSADAVAGLFVKLLFLGEGKANLDLDRSAAVAFLNLNETGAAPSMFASLDPNSVAYDTRVRSMVGFLMGLPRFQEQ
jgi:uncharacterized protein (DUF1800 family)